MKTRTLFRNNISAAPFVVMSDKAKTGWSATWKCAQRMRTAGMSKITSALTVVRN